MSAHKVHIIEPDFQAPIETVVKNRDELGRAISKLAKSEGETVYFHDFKEPVAGAPVVMLECSDDFLEKVKKLPGAANVYEHDVTTMPTARDAAVQHYFNEAAKPPKVICKKPKPGPRP